ncbi:hypothetical protein Fcan01_19333 [Folsomia candida]|uniref:Uncharacterized protein n=1 Tax=Folsomia candida TaxID=158441 RepID=A0A226DL70_FOLCA|nr:hypothetical protein Fcan01_19333 [Folsomia candida]
MKTGITSHLYNFDLDKILSVCRADLYESNGPSPVFLLHPLAEWEELKMRGVRLLFGGVQCVFLFLVLQSTFVRGVSSVMNSTHWSIRTSLHGGAAFIAFYGGLTVKVVNLGWKKQPFVLTPIV